MVSLLFKTLSRFDIVILQKSSHLLISWLLSPSKLILEPKKMKSDTVSTFSPSICHEVIGPDAMILVFECWVLSQLFHSPLSPSSRGSLSASSLSAIKVVSSAYLRLLIFLSAIMIPACDSSSLAFCIMHISYMSRVTALTYSFLNYEPMQCSMSSSKCCFLPCIQDSQVKWTDIPISLRIFQFVAFPSGSVSKESACNVGDLGSIPGSGRSPGEGNGNPLQYSGLENSMDRGVW